jgi:cob(I)alamin adenosyltransferase
VGAILATPPEKEVKKNGELRLKNLGILESDIELLEKEIDAMEEALPPMTHFVLPGGHPTVSHCHIARCICRRAERLAVHLDHNEPVAEIVIKYLNRLSDYLFVLARKLSNDLNAEEVKWIPRK